MGKDNKEKEGGKKTSETGFEIESVYGPSSVPDFDPEKSLGRPGEVPFTRHIYPTGYRKRPWQFRLYSGYGQAEDTNERWKYLLSQGNNGVSCAFDLPTQVGLDSDDPLAEEEVGRVGVAIDSIRDFEVLFDRIPLDRVLTSFNINAPVAVILAMLLTVAEKQGVAPEKLGGTFSNDILMEYVARGMWLFPPEPSLRLVADVAEHVSRRMPNFYPFNIRGVLLHEARANPAQEMGYTFSIARRYIDELIARGIPIDDFAPRISFFFSAGLHFFEEAAKFRAGRRLWAHLVRDEYGAKNTRSCLMRFTATAGGSWFRTHDPELNLVRGALGALGCVLGGTQAMLMPALDEPFAIPTEKTARLALRTQQIMAEETDVCYTADPLGGSYFVEAMTDRIENEILRTMEETEKVGGIVEAICKGIPQRAIADRAYRIQVEEESGVRPVVGVNKYESPEADADMEFHETNTETLDKQRERLRALRKERSANRWEKTLDGVRRAAEGNENMIPSLVDAVKAEATVGEIIGVLKEIFGEFEEPTTL